jgi:hypothetical protein
MADINLGVGGANSAVAGGYEIANSLKLERANSEQVRATGTTDSGNRKTWTFSTWIKRTEISYNGGFGINALLYAANTGMQINSSDKISIRMYNGSAYTGDLLTTQVFRDTSAWYHIVWTLDTTQSTASNRIKLWINGQQVTDFDTENYPNLNDEFQIGQASSAAPIRIGNAYWGTSPFSAYIAETHYLNGTAKQASDFGEYDADSGIWIPKEYTDGGYGDIGFYYKYDNASSLGEDSSGEGHDANGLVNITSADQATDTPTNNFATFNPLLPNSSERDGATVFINPDAGADTNLSTIAVANGKWYAEFKASSNISGDNGMVGVAANSGDSIAGRFLGQDAWSVGLLTNGSYYINSSATSYLGTTFNQDIISVALDMDNKKVYFAKNGTWGNSGNPATGTNGIALPSAYEDYEWFIGTSLVLSTATYDGNYGGYTVISIASGNTDDNGYGNFEYAPPSGYYALCSRNLSEFG